MTGAQQRCCELTAILVCKMLDYNVPGGKLNRGMAVADTLAAVRHPEVGWWAVCLSSSTTAQ